MRFIRWVAEDPAYIPRLVELGVHAEAVKHIRDDDSRGSTSMSLLRTFAALEGTTRSKLREDGVLDHVLPLLNRLKPENVGVERIGFNAASIVSRLAGNDEAGGMGSETLHGNPLIIQSLIAFLNGAVDGGAQGDFLNMKISPHFITMDILVVRLFISVSLTPLTTPVQIAASDANKPLLAPAIEIIFKAVKLRASNVKMVHDITNILLLLSFDPVCLAELQKQGKAKFALLGAAIPLTDKQECMAFENLMMKVFPSASKSTAAAVETVTGKFRGLLKSSSSTAMKRKSVTITKHVMISYNWGSKPLVLHVNEMLNQAGIKTWIDVKDMGGNISDSMAHAVENASYLVAFVTAAYKESGNCRRECEYADTFGVPIVYVMAQQAYKPNGWLAMQMGKSLYVEIATLEEANERVPQITARVTNTSVVAAPAASPAPINMTGDTNLLLKALMDKLVGMEEEIKSANTKLGSMEKEITELKSLLLLQKRE